MSDLESRLTEALTSGAEEAPEPESLARRARRRARTRHRTRLAVGIGVVVAALAVPATVLAGGDGGGRTVASDPSDPGTDAWRTVAHDGVLVDVPSGWQQLDISTCDFMAPRFGPPGSDPCRVDQEGLGVYSSAKVDAYRGPGVFEDAQVGWLGYVNADGWVVSARTRDVDVARRILGSARQQGEEIPDLSQGWRTAKYGGLFVDVPAAWQQGHLNAWCLDESVPGWIERPGMAGPDVDCVESSNGYGLLFQEGILRGTEGVYPHESGDQYPVGSWIGLGMARNGRYVTVVAPTQALAEVIVASVRRDQ